MAEVGSMPDSIYLLQDPYYTPAGRPGVRKPSNFHSVGTARAAIYVSSIQSCAFVPMPQFTCHDIATGILEGGCLKQPVVVASVYLEDCRNSREAKPVILPMMEELVNFCANKNMRLIMGLDSNAHSPLWGSVDTNKRGETLEEFIFQKSLHVHNVGHEPTWEVLRRNCSSIIDITLSLNLGDEIHDWHVSQKESISDHKMICFVLGSAQNANNWSRNYTRAKWKVFNDHICENLKEPPQLWSESIVEKSLDHFYYVIETGLDKSCPKHKIKRNDSLLWWNQDCENARNHYISIRKRVRKKVSKQEPLSETLAEEVKSSHRKLRYIIRKSKRDSFRDLVKEVSSVSEMSRLNKILDRKEARSLGLVVKADGSPTCSTEETLAVMLNEHFPGNEPLQDYSR